MKRIILTTLLTLAISCDLNCKAQCQQQSPIPICFQQCDCHDQQISFYDNNISYKLIPIQESELLWTQTILGCDYKILNHCLYNSESDKQKLQCVKYSGCSELLFTDQLYQCLQDCSINCYAYNSHDQIQSPANFQQENFGFSESQGSDSNQKDGYKQGTEFASCDSCFSECYGKEDIQKYYTQNFAAIQQEESVWIGPAMILSVITFMVTLGLAAIFLSVKQENDSTMSLPLIASDLESSQIKRFKVKQTVI